MATTRVRLTFEPQLVPQPVVYWMGHRFQVVTSIRMAQVDEYTGWVVLEVEGDPGEIERCLNWVREQGVRVDDATLGDVVEG
jgi:L-aspartate semialdehyde sulfurtransferase ferredoxin